MSEEKDEWPASAQNEEQRCSPPQNDTNSQLLPKDSDSSDSLRQLAKAIENQTKEQARTNDLIVNLLAQTAAFIEMIGEQIAEENEEKKDLGLYLDNTPAPPGAARRRDTL